MAMHDTIAHGNADAAMDMFLDIDDQVAHLADPNFSRRKGRKPGSLELVEHPNYTVVLEQNASSVIALALLRACKIHMTPEHTLQAFQQLRAKTLYSVHNSTCDLAFHPWQDPLERLAALAQQHQVDLATPQIGEVLTVGQPRSNVL